MTNDVTKNELTNKDRRKAIFGAAAGGALLSAWSAPVIKTIVLPAHANMSEDVVEDQVEEEEDQNTPDVDFFATSATATLVGTTNVNVILEALVPSAYAQSLVSEPSNIDPEDLVFEAEAISMGDSIYDIKIAAQIDPVTTRVSEETEPTYLYGWSGSITGLDNPTLLSKTGCADDEMVTITSVSETELTLKMDYFSNEITLDLEAGDITMPSFPFACSQNA